MNEFIESSKNVGKTYAYAVRITRKHSEKCYDLNVIWHICNMSKNSHRIDVLSPHEQLKGYVYLHMNAHSIGFFLL